MKGKEGKKGEQKRGGRMLKEGWAIQKEHEYGNTHNNHEYLRICKCTVFGKDADIKCMVHKSWCEDHNEASKLLTLSLIRSFTGGTLLFSSLFFSNPSNIWICWQNCKNLLNSKQTMKQLFQKNDSNPIIWRHLTHKRRNEFLSPQLTLQSSNKFLDIYNQLLQYYIWNDMHYSVVYKFQFKILYWLWS